jgi:hypothetical protein
MPASRGLRPGHRRFDARNDWQARVVEHEVDKERSGEGPNVELSTSEGIGPITFVCLSYFSWLSLLPRRL